VLLRGDRALPRRLWRLRPHYVLGYTAAAGALAHSVLSITTRELPPGAQVGLWLASVAAALLVAQVLVGRSLRDPAPAGRARRRTLHLTLLGTVLVLVGLHAALNGPWPP
jgi:cytochrome b561